MGPRYPTHFETDDVLDTAKLMGARVIRAQTLGDSVGCDLCIEPKPGEFNPEAFKSIDYAVKAAHDRGLRYVITLIGDCTYCDNGGIGQYVEWAGSKNMNDFFSDPKAIAMFEKHIAALLNHKSTLTGIALKDDPTVMAWENCNMCGFELGMMSGPKIRRPAGSSRWVGYHRRFYQCPSTRSTLTLDNSWLFLDGSLASLTPRLHRPGDRREPTLTSTSLVVADGTARSQPRPFKKRCRTLSHRTAKPTPPASLAGTQTNWSPPADDLQAALNRDWKIRSQGFRRWLFWASVRASPSNTAGSP